MLKNLYFLNLFKIKIFYLKYCILFTILILFSNTVFNVYAYSYAYENNLKKAILIYSGPGVSKSSLKQTKKLLKEYSTEYEIKFVNHIFLKNKNWGKNTKLLIIPGGADLPYTKHLNGKINKKIKNYIKQGGKYLGICAGAYYASHYIEFAKDNPRLKVIGYRELSFFPGTSIGPIYKGFNYKNRKGARAAYIEWIKKDKLYKKNFYSYYNGGGYFLDADKYPNIKTLAFYKKPKYPAIIFGKYKQGTFILSGVHFETSPDSLDAKNKYLKDIAKILLAHKQKRKTLAFHILDLLLKN